MVFIIKNMRVSYFIEYINFSQTEIEKSKKILDLNINFTSCDNINTKS